MQAEVNWNQGEENLKEEDLLKLLKNLPEVTNRVFNLFAIDGYSHKEIGKMLGISDGTSKWHVAEARKRLIKDLEELKKKEHKVLESK